jgi:hypothetical protein
MKSEDEVRRESVCGVQSRASCDSSQYPTHVIRLIFYCESEIVAVFKLFTFPTISLDPDPL